MVVGKGWLGSLWGNSGQVVGRGGGKLWKMVWQCFGLGKEVGKNRARLLGKGLETFLVAKCILFGAAENLFLVWHVDLPRGAGRICQLPEVDLPAAGGWRLRRGRWDLPRGFATHEFATWQVDLPGKLTCHTCRGGYLRCGTWQVGRCARCAWPVNVTGVLFQGGSLVSAGRKIGRMKIMVKKHPNTRVYIELLVE